MVALFRKCEDTSVAQVGGMPCIHLWRHFLMERWPGGVTNAPTNRPKVRATFILPCVLHTTEADVDIFPALRNSRGIEQHAGIQRRRIESQSADGIPLVPW